MSLDKYIEKNYSNDLHWFKSEVEQPYHLKRITDALNNTSYLMGKHEILNKGDVVHKGTEFKTSKMILQLAKSIINFHATYTLGRPITLAGELEIVNQFNKEYRRGKYNSVNYNIINNMIKFGDAYEYVYNVGKQIKSKVFENVDCYPVYDDTGEYVAFIEYYTDIVTNQSHYTVYSEYYVEAWNDDGGELKNIDKTVNLSGIPIHYKNGYGSFGTSILDDIKPILDKLEVLLNRLDDSIYTLSTNPLGVISGQSIEGSADSEGIGFVLSLEDGAEFKWAVAELDSESIKLLLNTLLSQLWTIAQVPSIVMGNSNVSNVSEVSLKLLFSLAHNKGLENVMYLQDGFYDRHEKMKKLMKFMGYDEISNLDIDVEFSLNRPTDDLESVEILSKQYNDGVISLDTYLKKSPSVNNVEQEKERLKKQ